MNFTKRTLHWLTLAGAIAVGCAKPNEDTKPPPECEAPLRRIEMAEGRHQCGSGPLAELLTCARSIGVAGIWDEDSDGRTFGVSGQYMTIGAKLDAERERVRKRIVKYREGGEVEKALAKTLEICGTVYEKHMNIELAKLKDPEHPPEPVAEVVSQSFDMLAPISITIPRGTTCEAIPEGMWKAHCPDANSVLLCPKLTADTGRLFAEFDHGHYTDICGVCRYRLRCDAVS